MDMNLFIICRECNSHHTITVDEQALKNWKNGMLIQRAFPTLSINDRELLKTQICGPCFDKMFASED